MRRKVFLSKLTCILCRYPVVIPRTSGKARPAGHIKTYWCIRCRRRTPHVENLGPLSAQARREVFCKANFRSRAKR